MSARDERLETCQFAACFHRKRNGVNSCKTRLLFFYFEANKLFVSVFDVETTDSYLSAVEWLPAFEYEANSTHCSCGCFRLRCSRWVCYTDCLFSDTAAPFDLNAGGHMVFWTKNQTNLLAASAEKHIASSSMPERDPLTPLVSKR